jgi:hypothetical protein
MVREVHGNEGWSEELEDGLLPQLVRELAPQPVGHRLVHLQTSHYRVKEY